MDSTKTISVPLTKEEIELAARALRFYQWNRSNWFRGPMDAENLAERLDKLVEFLVEKEGA